MWWLIGIAAGLFILSKKTNRNYTGLKEPSTKIISLVIGQQTDGGYPMEIEWEDGIISNEVYSESDAQKIVSKAKADGARIVEDAFGGGYAIQEEPAQKSIVVLKYRDLGDDMYYAKIDFYDGTHREGKYHKDYFEITLRNAKRDGATISTF